MKTKLILIVALFAFALNSCKDDADKTNPTENVDTYPYDGNWTGTYAGDDNGTVTITITTDGKLSGSAYSENAMTNFSLSGVVDSDGNLTATSTTTGATFSGKLTPPNGSGTWTNAAIGGTWTATKK